MISSRIFNIHDVALIMTACEALIFAILLTLKQRRQIQHYLLACFLALSAAGTLQSMLLYAPPVRDWFLSFAPFETHFLLEISLFLEAPIFFLYIKSLTYNELTFNRLDSIPLVTYLAGLAVVFFTPLSEQLWQANLYFLSLSHALSFMYGIAILYHIRKYRLFLENSLSSYDKSDFFRIKLFAYLFAIDWLWLLLTSMTLSFAPSYLVNILGLIHSYFVFVIINVLVFSSLGYTGALVGMPHSKPGKSKKKEVIKVELTERIEAYMREHKPHLINNITLDNLAEKLDMSPKTLSNIINKYYQKTFFEFINDYRIQDAILLLQDPANNSRLIQDIYESVGFNSKSTFNTIFKKVTGLTPAKYRNVRQQ